MELLLIGKQPYETFGDCASAKRFHS
jgi:hypothetical protein